MNRIGTRPRPYIEPRVWPEGTPTRERIDTILDDTWRSARDFSELADLCDSSTRNCLQLFTEAGIAEMVLGSGTEPNRYRRKKLANG